MVSNCSASFSVKAAILDVTVALAEEAEVEVLLIERVLATLETLASGKDAVFEVLLVARVLGGAFALVDDAEVEVLLVERVFDILSRVQLVL